MIHSTEAEIRETDTTVTDKNYFHYPPVRPYNIQTSCYSLKLILEVAPSATGRQGTRQPLSGGESQDASTALNTDFSDVRITELFGKHSQNILLNAKVQEQRGCGERISAQTVVEMEGVLKG